MKIIILISSFFYILGLKIGTKIDLVKKSVPVKKIITNTIKTKTNSDCCDYKKEKEEVAKKEDKETSKKEKSSSKTLQESRKI